MTENTDKTSPDHGPDDNMRMLEHTAVSNVLALLAAEDDNHLEQLALRVAESYAGEGNPHRAWVIFVTLRTFARMYRSLVGQPMSPEAVAEALKTLELGLLDPDRYNGGETR